MAARLAGSHGKPLCWEPVGMIPPKHSRPQVLPCPGLLAAVRKQLCGVRRLLVVRMTLFLYSRLFWIASHGGRPTRHAVTAAYLVSEHKYPLKSKMIGNASRCFHGPFARLKYRREKGNFDTLPRQPGPVADFQFDGWIFLDTKKRKP